MSEWKGLAATILVVVDREVNSDLLDGIGGNGRTVEQAIGGEDARWILRTAELDLVLLDLAIDDIPALELIDLVRQNSPGTQIVVLAGADEVAAAVDAMERGAGDYLTKPLGLKELRAAVDKALERRRLHLASNIATIVQRIASVTEVDALPPRVVEAALQATRAFEASLYLLEDGGLRLVESNAPTEASAVAEVADQVLNTSRPMQTVEEEEGPILGWPMAAHNHGIGVLVVRRKPGKDHFSASDEQQLSVVATEAALSIDRVRLIDHLRHQVDELARARLQLAAAEQLQGVGQLATSYAHELTGPLQVLQSHLRSVASALEANEPDEAKSAVRYALESAARVQAAVGELSLLGRNKDDAVIDSARLVGLARRMALAGSGLELTEDVVDVSVQGNVGHLVQALVHLLRNGARACSDVDDPRLQLRVRADGGFARFEVVDNGPGISDAVKDRIFEPFVTQWEGHAGLGLGIAREIAENAGGHVEIERDEGGGTLARLLLPVLQDEGTLELGDD